MTVKALETMFERLTLLEAATTPAELCVALLEATKRFGVTSVLGGIIPDVASSHTTHANGVILADWPSQWANRYFSKGYLPRDPTILRVKISQQAFMWRELGEEGILAKSSNRVMHEAADFGLVAGFTIPILSVGGAKAAISFAGSVMELSLEDQTYVKLLGMVS
jgi:LuxR family quorum sensing-dependent transcriptional regulator